MFQTRSAKPARPLTAALLATPLLWAGGSHRAEALVILPSFDLTITGNANAPQIMADINQAASVYRMYTDPVTVTIFFQGAHQGTNSFLGASGATQYGFSYASYTNALHTDAITYNNSIELTAFNHLASGNKATNIFATSADARALGCSNCLGTVSHIDFSNSTVVFGGSYDGAIGLNLDQPFSLTRTNGTIPGGTYDIITTIEHEIDEILGIGGQGSLLPNFANGNQIGPMDLYRYSAAGTPTLSTSGTAYFSIDGGATNIAGFNQTNGGDFGDWVTGTGRVQDAFTFSGQVADISPTSPESIALQAVGYDLPEPGTLTLLAAGAVLMSGLRSRRRRK
ncbi:MAG: PEP-CTERM sorting domain-containing protein [Acetobacteraceae bacterium]|nr:PEP-CTERM sorting domain-containing protein [Acetobacteraceae bacterium]